MIKAIIFDLDDTLILESEYVLSGFREVSKYVSMKYLKGKGEESIYNYLKEIFLRQGRKQIFNKLYRDFNIVKVSESTFIDNLVSIYRGHKPNISVDKKIIGGLTAIKLLGIKIGLLTDGLPLMQMNKVEALGFKHVFDEIVYSWEINCPKPEPAGIEFILNRLDVKPGDSYMIGDNPFHDIEPAISIGMKTCRIYKGRFKEVIDKEGFLPNLRVNRLEEFFRYVEQVCSK